MPTAGLGIDRLLDFLFEILYLLKFWVVLDEYQQGVVLTWGKRRYWWVTKFFFRRKSPVLKSGLHLLIPFGIECVIIDNVVPCDLPDLTISMTLKDGTPLFVSFSALWQITDIEVYKLAIENADTVLTNVEGMVQEYLFQFTWDELLELRKGAVENKRRAGLAQKLKTYCNQEIKKWGAELTEFYVQDFIRPELKTGVVKIL